MVGFGVKKCITPHWGTSTHDELFSAVCRDLGLAEVPVPGGRRRHPVLYAISVIVTIPLFLLAYCAHLVGFNFRHLTFYGYNLFKSWVDHVVCASSSGRFRFCYSSFDHLVYGLFTLICAILEVRRGGVGLILGGDDAYLEFSLLAQVGDRFGVPVYFFRQGKGVYATTYVSEFHSAMPEYTTFPTKFPVDKGEVDLASDRLRSRISGSRIGLDYMPSFSGLTAEAPPGAIWIYLHDFFDSPGVYGGNIYLDHVTWVEKTIEFISSIGGTAVIKCHPNGRERNTETIAFLRGKFGDSCFWLEGDISVEGVARLDPKCVVTVYGTVIIEASFAGIPVIAASTRSPTSGFRLAHEASSEKMYFDLLKQAATGALHPRQPTRAAAEAMASIGKYFGSRKYLDVPMDDITPDLWEEIGLGSRPDTNHARREIFLKNDAVRNWMKSRLLDVDVADALGIRIP